MYIPSTIACRPSDIILRQGLSSLGIILREIYKAEHELSNGFANVTSALVMQMPGYKLPRYCVHDSTNCSEDGESHDNAVMVAIETSQLDDRVPRPVSMISSP